MKIYAIDFAVRSQIPHTNRNVQFKGILAQKYSSSEEYEGCSSGSSYDGHYHGFNDSESYVYYPFKDESQHEIEKVMKENNYSQTYDPDMNGGFSGGCDVSTEKGPTLPITKAEWAKYSKNKYGVPYNIRVFIEETLRRYDLSRYIE